MASQDVLYQEALDAITKLFSDTSVPRAITKSNLEELAGEIEIMLDSIDT